MKNFSTATLFNAARIFKIVVYAVMLMTYTHASAQQEHWESVFDFQLKVAKMGSLSGQFRVAEMYEEGRGVDRDLQKALEWYEKASLQGHKEAARRIEAIRAGKPRPAYIAKPSPQPDPVEKAKLEKEEDSLKLEMEALQKERERIDREKKRLASERAQLNKEREKQAREKAAAEERRKKMRAEQAMREMMAIPDAME